MADGDRRRSRCRVAHDAPSGYRLNIATDTRTLNEQRELDEFLSLIAHDLRTPLTAIKGYAQLVLRQRRGQPTDDPVAESLRTIIGQADRLDEMTAALLDISRIRVGRVPLRPGTVDVRGIARRIFLEQHEVTADIDAPEPSPSAEDSDAVVDGDAARIGQIIRTMATFLATREGRGALSARLTSSAEHVRVTVEDDGVPFTTREAGLFERLVEAAPNSPTGWQIARPDLYIARGLAEAHGGTLEAESPVDRSQRGVRLTLTLPRAPTAA